MSQQLEPITPKRAKKMYLNARKHEVSESTISGYHYRLKHFIRWCDQRGIDNMNDLTGRKLQAFRTWRQEDGDLKPITLEGNLDALRVFIRWAESIDAVHEGLHDKIIMPTLSKEDEQSEDILTAEEAERLLQYLRRFEYGSRGHVIIELLWHTGMRLGTLRSLDTDGYDREREVLVVQHRPDRGTALKNGREGERHIALDSKVCTILDAYIEQYRDDVTDSEGRSPLITTTCGRIAGSSIRDAVYKVTRPCYYTNDCPEGREIETCEGAHHDGYSKCPLNVSPHAIRRGSITHHLSQDVPEKVVGDRMNVGQDVLDKHYDKRTKDQKVEQRRGYLDNV
jgi:site-specific recombinase XerD